jgi:hypothetical protein
MVFFFSYAIIGVAQEKGHLSVKICTGSCNLPPLSVMAVDLVNKDI